MRTMAPLLLALLAAQLRAAPPLYEEAPSPAPAGDEEVPPLAPPAAPAASPAPPPAPPGPPDSGSAAPAASPAPTAKPKGKPVEAPKKKATDSEQGGAAQNMMQGLSMSAAGATRYVFDPPAPPGPPSADGIYASMARELDAAARELSLPGGITARSAALSSNAEAPQALRDAAAKMAKANSENLSRAVGQLRAADRELGDLASTRYKGELWPAADRLEKAREDFKNAVLAANRLAGEAHAQLKRPAPVTAPTQQLSELRSALRVAGEAVGRMRTANADALGALDKAEAAVGRAATAQGNAASEVEAARGLDQSAFAQADGAGVSELWPVARMKADQQAALTRVEGLSGRMRQAVELLRGDVAARKARHPLVEGALDEMERQLDGGWAECANKLEAAPGRINQAYQACRASHPKTELTPLDPEASCDPSTQKQPQIHQPTDDALQAKARTGDPIAQANGEIEGAKNVYKSPRPMR